MKNIFDKVCKDGPNIIGTACWIWLGLKDKDGYGKKCFGSRKNRKNYTTHRLFYELTYGPIPLGLLVCHKCDNTPCVNPSHLFLGSVLDNNRDKVKKGRGPSGERNPAAKLSWGKVRKIRKQYSTGQYSQQNIANEYGVIQNLISKIILKKIWKE